MKHIFRKRFTWVFALALAALVIIPFAAFAHIATDRADYSPGSVVTISGDNSDGAGYLDGETVHVVVSGPNGYNATCDATTAAGTWSCQVALAGDESAVGDYSYTASGVTSGVSQSGTFTDGPATPQTTVVWTGQGVGNDGRTCDATNSDLLSPGPGQKGWLFVLQQISGTPADWRLDVNFGPGTADDQTGLTPIQTTANVAKWAVYSAANASLDGATAYATLNGGTSSGNLVVSHCFTGETQAQDLTVSKTATPSFTRTFTWGISKDVDATEIDIAAGGSATFNYTVDVTKDAGTDSDFAVNGTITVHNPNSFAVNGVNVSDATPGGNCTVTGSPLDVPAGGDATAPYTCTFASNPGSGTNTATATWTDFGSPNTSASGTADFTFGDPTTKVNDCVTVSDPLDSGSPHTFCSSGSFSYSFTTSGNPGTCTSYNNTATIVETGQSASKTVKVCVGADLTVSKTANPSFDLKFAWNITKDVDKTLVEQVGGGSATFNYTIKVSHDAGTDSNWQVNGQIVVSNPNDWEDITADVSDAIPGGNCTVTGGTGVSVPASGSVTLDYSCTFGSNPGSGTNTATATWDSATFFTPSDSASGTADFAFGDPTNLIDECVNVSDSFAGSLGTVCVGDANPTTFTYSRTVSVPQFDCVSYDNTATFTTNDTGATGSASQTVKVCGPAKTGALTMGFWQNKNGQGIITGGASVSGVCKSGTWLRQFAPFQDLSATATCAQVATYVTNVIKAANASGAAMNAMLKAQMLATALDVYFSDLALGGNKISAPVPLGGVAIDLTQICKDIATCSIYEDVSSAFGGATSMTVSQMLAYAASQSNAGGSVWYGQVKATQELAKDAFDAINNQVAFAP